MEGGVCWRGWSLLHKLATLRSCPNMDDDLSVEEEQGKCRCLKSAYDFCWNEEENHFPPIRIFFLLGACLFIVIDVGLDIWVAYEHYVADRDGTDDYASYYLYSTLFFIIVPQIVINLISWLLYTWGFIVFNSKRIRNYYRRQLEDLKYVEFDEAGNRRKDSLHVENKCVISWPWYDKSKQRRTKAIHQLVPVTSSSPSPTNSSAPIPFGSPQDQNSLISSPGPASPNYQQETTFNGGDLWGRKQSAASRTKVKVYKHKRTESETPILEETDTHLEFYPLDLFDIYEYILVTLLHILLLGFIFRVVRLVYKSKSDKYSFDRYRDVSFLRLMESFLEAAPQLVLQLYIVIVREESRLSYNIITPISIVFSVCSLALSVADYISAVKDLYYYDPPPHRERKPRLTWTGYFLVIFWHLCMIVGRGITFALFASIYGGYLFLVVGVHYVAMVYWMYWQQASVLIHSSEDYDSRSRNGRRPSATNTTTHGRRSIRSCIDPRNHICGNYGIEFIVAAFNIFFHFKLKEGGSVETLVPFYVLSFVENVLMIFLWYFARDLAIYTWYAIPAVVTVFVSFALGLLFLSLYYYKFQPHKQNSLEPDPSLDHPTMTSTMSRMYLQKQVKGNIIQRLFNLARGERRQSNDAVELEAVDNIIRIPAN